MREESERLGIQEVRSFVFVKTLALNVHRYQYMYTCLLYIVCIEQSATEVLSFFQ